MLLRLLEANLRCAQKSRVNLKSLLGKHMGGLIDEAVPAAESVLDMANAFIADAKED